MKNLPMSEAVKIEAVLNQKGFDFELGYDKEDLLHICCGVGDEIKISEAIDDMKLGYTSFMWFGSFASDAIVKELDS